MNDGRRETAESLKQGGNHIGHKRFTRPSEPEAGHRDTQLARRKIGIQVSENVLCNARTS